MGKKRSDEADEIDLANRGASRAVRLLRLLDLLRSRRRGIRQRELVEEFAVTRQTIDKYLKDLEAAGIPLVRTARGGEAWLGLGGDWLIAPSAAEIFALVVARQALQGLPNSAATQWLAPRLRQLTTTPRVTIEAIGDGVDTDAVVRAVMDRKRLRLTYRGLKDTASKQRLVEPIELRFSQRAWYLFCLDVDRREPRTFKLSRVVAAQVVDEACSLGGVVDAEREHEHTVSVWTSSALYDVAVRIHPPQARVAHEYPLTAMQTVAADGDAVIVRARVAGLEEVTRWVLRWGRDAEVLEPPALRDRLRAEVQAMQAWLQ